MKSDELLKVSEETVKMLEEQAKIQQALKNERYNTLLSFILNNSKLNYDNSRLTIDYGEIVLEYLKAIEPQRYEQKYNELIHKKEENN